MKKQIITCFLYLGYLMPSLYAQSNTSFQDFPIVVSLQFHSLATPFSNLKSNFKNIGIGIGTETSYDRKRNFVQQFQLVWYRNKAAGNGLLLSTQTAWRPYLQQNFYTEVRTGIEYLWALRPTKSFQQKNGKWISARKKGKGMITIPVGVAVGVRHTNNQSFFSYQMLLMTKYNNSIPVFPATFIQIGNQFYNSK